MKEVHWKDHDPEVDSLFEREEFDGCLLWETLNEWGFDIWCQTYPGEEPSEVCGWIANISIKLDAGADNIAGNYREVLFQDLHDVVLDGLDWEGLASDIEQALKPILERFTKSVKLYEPSVKIILDDEFWAQFEDGE